MPSPSRVEVTRILRAVEAGNPLAADQLLPHVYAELRRLGRGMMARVPPGNTLQATALVHEAYVRLVAAESAGWNSRGHFFGAAAQAMRQILVDQARRKGARKRGGDRRRVDVDDVDLPIDPPSDDMLALDEALERLKRQDPRKAQVVMLRSFAGLTTEETAKVLGLSVPTIERDWRYARALLYSQLKPEASTHRDQSP